MAFPSPAADFVESRISLDALYIKHPSATYFMRSATSYPRSGIIQGGLLVIDSSLNACDGSIVVCRLEGEFRLRRYRKHPVPCLELLSPPFTREQLVEDEYSDAPLTIMGIVTYVVNDARTEEFDDNPVM